MGINLCDIPIDGARVGDIQADKIYWGSTEVYSREEWYLTFVANSDGGYLSLLRYGNCSPSLQYSRDKVSWTQWDPSYSNISLEGGKPLYLRGYNPDGLSFSESEYVTFNIVGAGGVHCYGSVMSLINGDSSIKTVPSRYCFYRLFYNNTQILSAPRFTATELSLWCYRQAFKYCSSLTTPMELPATSVPIGGYYETFHSCTALQKAPNLPATALSEYAYSGLFRDCKSLTEAPDLPATTLAGFCYNYLFAGCNKIKRAPDLPSETLPQYCYNYMFKDCSSLNYVKCLAINTSTTNCTSNWLSGVSSSGTFIKNPNKTNWPRGNSGIPSNWSVIDNS